MRVVFADAGYWIALWNPGDAGPHERGRPPPCLPKGGGLPVSAVGVKILRGRS